MKYGKGDLERRKTVRIRAVLDIPVTDEELYDLCVRSNDEGELDKIGMGYFEVQLTTDQVKDYLSRDYAICSEGEEDISWICGEDLEIYDKWFIEKKKEKFGRYDKTIFD